MSRKPEVRLTDEQGLIDWDEVQIDGTFAPVVSAFRSHALPRLLLLQKYTLAEEVLDQAPTGEIPALLIADRAYDSDRFRARMLQKG